MELFFDKKLDDHVYQYFLKNNKAKIGFSQIRTTPTKSKVMPENFESHIYYEIYEDFRNKGYGKDILKLTLIEAKKLNLKEIILTCLDSNTHSKKIIISNGGKLVETRLNKNNEKVNKYTLS